MKIAYVTEWDPHAPSGVLHKMSAQVEAWKSAGENVRIFFLAPRRDTPAAIDFGGSAAIIGRIAQASLERYRFARLGYVNKVVSAAVLRRAVKAFAPDVIYYRRQGPWYPGIGRILDLAPTVAELNGNAAGDAAFGKLNAAFTQATDTLWKRSVDGFVAVSPEIADEVRATGKPVETIPNSLARAPQPLPPTGNDAPAFVFVGSPLVNGGAWHGVDKIVDLATLLPRARFEIVGLTRAEMPVQEIPGNLRFHGPKFGADLKAVYRSCDVGLGTLALHRRGMETNSALKPLEYLSFGLPVVLGYRETEEALNAADYTLYIGNHEGNVRDHIDEIAAFAEAWRGKRVTADLNYLSGPVVERRRLGFLKGFA